MARILPGSMVSDARGQIGGVVFSRNAAGAYVRNNSSPVNPNTSRQQAIRSGFGQAAARWRDTLTAAQRAAWEAYAQQTPVPNVFGGKDIISGIAFYCRFNGTWISEGETAVDDGPTQPGQASKLVVTIAGNTTTGITLTAFTPTVATGNNIIILESGSAVSQSRNFYAGPFTRNAWMDGAETLPFTLKANTLVAVGQRWFFKFRVFMSDGRVGPATIASVDITA